MKIAIIFSVLILFVNSASATDFPLKQIGMEISFEGTLISAWQAEGEDGVELRIRFPRGWTLINFAREWPSWQGDMKGLHATFKTPDGFVTIFYGGKIFRSHWENLLGEALSFDKGITSIRKIKWIPM